jgi:hypothetical protein
LGAHSAPPGARRIGALRLFPRSAVANRAAHCVFGCTGAPVSSHQRHTAEIFVARDANHSGRLGGELEARSACGVAPIAFVYTDLLMHSRALAFRFSHGKILASLVGRVFYEFFGVRAAGRGCISRRS